VRPVQLGREAGVWRKARKSVGNGNCVEISRRDAGIAIRDSKNPTGPVLWYTIAEFDAFIDGAKSGEFDDLTHSLPTL
jgi:hypothetical protein